MTFVSKVMSLLFNMLSRFVIAFLPRSKNLLISWLRSPSAVILEPKKIILSLFPLFPHLFAIKWWDRMPWSSFYECWCFTPVFSLSSFTFIKRFFICISEVIDISYEFQINKYMFIWSITLYLKYLKIPGLLSDGICEEGWSYAWCKEGYLYSH